MPHTSYHVEHDLTSVCKQPDTYTFLTARPAVMHAVHWTEVCLSPASAHMRASRTHAAVVIMPQSRLTKPILQQVDLSRHTGIKASPFPFQKESLCSVCPWERWHTIFKHLVLLHELIRLQYICGCSHTQGAAASNGINCKVRTSV